MWPWQRNGERPNVLLIRRLLALSSLGHVCMLLFLFVFYHDDTSSLSRDVIAVLLDTNVTIVRVPMSKVVNKTVPVIGSSAAKSPAPAKKAAPPETALLKPKVLPKVEAAKTKKVAPKPKPEIKSKKETMKPKEPVVPKPLIPEHKKEEIKKIEPKQEEIKQPIVEEKIAQASDEKAVEQHIEHADNVVYVGQHEYAALEVQRQIQEEAERCWKAPPGIASDVACQIVVHVNHDGTVHDITVTEQSGILMYDVRARQAVSQMMFPRGSWGKEVVVYFRQ